MDNNLRFDSDEEAQARRRRAEHAGVSYGDVSSHQHRKRRSGSARQDPVRDPGYRQIDDEDWRETGRTRKPGKRGGGCLKSLLSILVLCLLLFVLVYGGLRLFYGNVAS